MGWGVKEKASFSRLWPGNVDCPQGERKGARACEGPETTTDQGAKTTHNQCPTDIRQLCLFTFPFLETWASRSLPPSTSHHQ